MAIATCAALDKSDTMTKDSLVDNWRTPFSVVGYCRRLQLFANLAPCIGFVACCFAFLMSDTAIAQSSPGLIGAYGFNEGIGTTLSDVSGNSNNGTITGATWSTGGKF